MAQHGIESSAVLAYLQKQRVVHKNRNKILWLTSRTDRRPTAVLTRPIRCRATSSAGRGGSAAGGLSVGTFGLSLRFEVRAQSFEQRGSLRRSLAEQCTAML